MTKTPGVVVEKLKQHESLRVVRRDGDDLILTTAERAERQEEVVDTIARTYSALMKTDEGARAVLLAMPEIFPWVRHLNDAEVREFLLELVGAVRDAAELDVYGKVPGVVAGWRATARIKADPEEYAEALRPLDGTDFGPVTTPEAAT
ncbi:prevent-host-death family protein [Streptacidiphilus fuscans]|uniref:prevent-host-death family protein n=1 Tax=Streptacidiphilus fuscans TaxID=2789292 RepID=UPI001F316AB3|nr:prevent-host-death family protein [Streptacidiphilus fuscans]